MDIVSIRLGMAYTALRQALGEDFAPISFADSSMAFQDARIEATFFCSAARDALWISLADAQGGLGSGNDEMSLALRARAEPTYLALIRGFEFDLDRAMAREAKAASAAARTAPAQPAKAIQTEAPIAAAPSNPPIAPAARSAKGASMAPREFGSRGNAPSAWAPTTVVAAGRRPVRMGPGAKA